MNKYIELNEGNKAVFIDIKNYIIITAFFNDNILILDVNNDSRCVGDNTYYKITVADNFDFERFLRNFREYLLNEHSGIFNLSN